MPLDNTSCVEITFTPTPQDYAKATRWITRRAMGNLYWLYITAIASIGITAAFGFVLLFDAAVTSHEPATADQGLAGAVLFVAVLYIGLAVRVALRRLISRRTYIEDGYLLAPRTMIFTADGVQSNSVHQQMSFNWQNVMGIYDDKEHLFVQIETAFTLFIPKRIAKTPEELTQLHEFANKMRSESVAKA